MKKFEAAAFGDDIPAYSDTGRKSPFKMRRMFGFDSGNWATRLRKWSPIAGVK
jgi:hypothetical protein